MGSRNESVDLPAPCPSTIGTRLVINTFAIIVLLVGSPRRDGKCSVEGLSTMAAPMSVLGLQLDCPLDGLPFQFDFMRQEGDMSDVRHVRMGLVWRFKRLTLHRSLTIEEAASILHAGRPPASAVVTLTRGASHDEDSQAGSSGGKADHCWKPRRGFG